MLLRHETMRSAFRDPQPIQEMGPQTLVYIN